MTEPPLSDWKTALECRRRETLRTTCGMAMWVLSFVLSFFGIIIAILSSSLRVAIVFVSLSAIIAILGYVIITKEEEP